MHRTKAEIVELRRKILLERLVRTVMRVGTISFHTRMIAKAGEEKRLAARQLWNGKRAFEAEIADLEDCLHDGYRVLATTDLESEKLRTDIDDMKRVTIKLSHWKDVNLRSASLADKEIERLSSTGNVNVDRLLAKLQSRHDELDAVMAETDEFEQELEASVHKPMKAKEATQKAIRTLIAEKVAMRQAAAETDLDESNQRGGGIRERNETLRAANAKLRQQIAALEEQKKTGGHDRKRYIDGLFPTPETARIRSSARVTKPVARGAKAKSARPLYLNV
jgi:chromosome segregation ATPase